MELVKKIVVLGNFGVGKTSLIRKFVTNEFSSDYKVTIGVHILKKEFISDKNKITFILWDLEGTDLLNKINKVYLSGAYGFIYVYDVTRQSTYKNLQQDINFLNENYKNTLIKVVGNKVDIITEEAYNTIKSLAQKTDFLSSAKTGENIEEIFTSLAKELT